MLTIYPLCLEGKGAETPLPKKNTKRKLADCIHHNNKESNNTKNANCVQMYHFHILNVRIFPPVQLSRFDAILTASLAESPQSIAVTYV